MFFLGTSCGSLLYADLSARVRKASASMVCLGARTFSRPPRGCEAVVVLSYISVVQTVLSPPLASKSNLVVEYMLRRHNVSWLPIPKVRPLPASKNHLRFLTFDTLFLIAKSLFCFSN